MFSNWLKGWETNPKNKNKLNPPRISSTMHVNDRSINNFLEQHGEIIEVKYNNNLYKYKTISEYVGRRTYRVWGELIKGQN